MKFEEKLTKLRKEKAFSQEELGEKLNVTRQTISKWELGQSKPDVDKLKEMSNLFGVSLEELTNDEAELKDKKIKGDENKKIIIIAIITVAVLIVLSIIIKVAFFGKVYNDVSKESDTIQGIFDGTYNTMKDNDSSTKGLMDKGIGIFNDALDLMQDEINKQKEENKKEAANSEANVITENNIIVNEQNNNINEVANQVQQMQNYVANQFLNF